MNVDDTKKLLDNKRCILLFRNEMGSYTAVAGKSPHEIIGLLEAADEVENATGDPRDCSWITDDFTPSKALCRLTEKLTTGRIVGADEPTQDP